MTVPAAWRNDFIERLKATCNVTLAAAGAGVNPWGGNIHPRDPD